MLQQQVSPPNERGLFLTLKAQVQANCAPRGDVEIQV